MAAVISTEKRERCYDSSCSSQRCLVLLDDASTIPSLLLTFATCLMRLHVWPVFVVFPPLLLTFDNQSLARGWRCLPSTGEIGVDEYSLSRYHLTNMDIQLSKNKRSCSLPSCPRSKGSVSDERIAPIRSSRTPTAAIFQLYFPAKSHSIVANFAGPASA
jgi:hypothetical protein